MKKGPTFKKQNVFEARIKNKNDYISRDKFQRIFSKRVFSMNENAKLKILSSQIYMAPLMDVSLPG